MRTTFIDQGEADVSMEKDATEEELEKLIFGDAAGFRGNLKSFKSSDAPADQQRESLVVQDRAEDIDEDDLEGVNDSDVGETYVRPASSIKSTKSSIALFPRQWTFKSGCARLRACSCFR